MEVDFETRRGLQMALNEALGLKLKVDGDLGPKTQAAIRQFQSNNAIPMSGKYDEQVQAFLGKKIAEKYIDHDDYEEAAAALGVHISVVRAFVEVEAGGDGFLPDGRVDILFERHKFRTFLYTELGAVAASNFEAKNPDIINKVAGGYLGAAKEYPRLERAIAINRKCALMSASYGMFQIMGFNHKAAGFDSVETFYEAMCKSEKEHLKAFVNFIKSEPKLHQALKTRNYALAASIYNGPKYKEHQYDVRLAAADKKFSTMYA